MNDDALFTSDTLRAIKMMTNMTRSQNRGRTYLCLSTRSVHVSGSICQRLPRHCRMILPRAVDSQSSSTRPSAHQGAQPIVCELHGHANCFPCEEGWRLGYKEFGSRPLSYQAIGVRVISLEETGTRSGKRLGVGSVVGAGKRASVPGGHAIYTESMNGRLEGRN